MKGKLAVENIEGSEFSRWTVTDKDNVVYKFTGKLIHERRTLAMVLAKVPGQKLFINEAGKYFLQYGWTGTISGPLSAGDVWRFAPEDARAADVPWEGKTVIDLDKPGPPEPKIDFRD